MLAAILTVSGVTSAQAQAEVAKTRGEQVPMAGPFGKLGSTLIRK